MNDCACDHIALRAEMREEVYADLCGVPEIAAALRIPMPRLKQWIERREATGCPSPIRVLKALNVYSLNEWKGWHAVWKVTRGSERWYTAKYY